MSHSSPPTHHPSLEQLVQEVEHLTQHSAHKPDTFNDLALRIFFHQYQNNLSYRRYCDRLRQTPAQVSSWQNIPAVPTDAFKFHESPLVNFPIETRQHTFHTSGTTTELKGHHHFPSIGLYEHSILEAWKQAELPTTENVIILTPQPENTPHSSLSHMMGTLTDHWNRNGDRNRDEHTTWGILPNGELDTPAIYAAIKSSIANNQPIALLGTALAFLHFFEQIDAHHQKFKLPTGSWAMETGGYKGTQRSLEKADLYAMFTSHLGLPADSVINEYSMTELSSQFYTRGLNLPHTGPTWTRIRVIDPITGHDAAPGQPGHLAIYDLANLYSVIAIQTQDLAIAHSDGEANNAFTLLGRDPSALPRGCSRAADDTLTPKSP